jgi:hypothetical protein
MTAQLLRASFDNAAQEACFTRFQIPCSFAMNGQGLAKEQLENGGSCV